MGLARRQNVAHIVLTLKESDPNGTRTRVTGVKGRCPRPLDDGASAQRQQSGLRRFSADRRRLLDAADLNPSENKRGACIKLI
jgi:hypothetical protein